MLTEWRAPNDFDWFVANHLGRAPSSAPDVAENAVRLFEWQTLDAVLASPLPVGLLTVAGGRLMDVPRPCSATAARRLMSAGVSVVVRGAERHDEGLRALASSFEQRLPGEVDVQLYCTPARTHSDLDALEQEMVAEQEELEEEGNPRGMIPDETGEAARI